MKKGCDEKANSQEKQESKHKHLYRPNGTAFWLMLFVLIAGIVMWAKFGSEKMAKVLSSGIGDAFGR